MADFSRNIRQVNVLRTVDGPVLLPGSLALDQDGGGQPGERERDRRHRHAADRELQLRRLDLCAERQARGQRFLRAVRLRRGSSRHEEGSDREPFGGVAVRPLRVQLGHGHPHEVHARLRPEVDPEQQAEAERLRFERETVRTSAALIQRRIEPAADARHHRPAPLAGGAGRKARNDWAPGYALGMGQVARRRSPDWLTREAVR